MSSSEEERFDSTKLRFDPRAIAQHAIKGPGEYFAVFCDFFGSH